MCFLEVFFFLPKFLAIERERIMPISFATPSTKSISFGHFVQVGIIPCVPISMVHSQLSIYYKSSEEDIIFLPMFDLQCCRSRSPSLCPSTRMLPCCGSYSLCSRCRTVLLPDPEPPTSATVSPALMSRVRPLSTCIHYRLTL